MNVDRGHFFPKYDLLCVVLIVSVTPGRSVVIFVIIVKIVWMFDSCIEEPKATVKIWIFAKLRANSFKNNLLKS